MELINTLKEARDEIYRLRHQNEILSAKVGVMESMFQMLRKPATPYTMGAEKPNCLFFLDQHINAEREKILVALAAKRKPPIVPTDHLTAGPPMGPKEAEEFENQFLQKHKPHLPNEGPLT